MRLFSKSKLQQAVPIICSFSALLFSCSVMANGNNSTTMFPECKTTAGTTVGPYGNGTFTGNLGGYSGADAICNSAFSGFRMARNFKSAAIASSGTVTGWMGGAGSEACRNTVNNVPTDWVDDNSSNTGVRGVSSVGPKLTWLGNGVQSNNYDTGPLAITAHNCNVLLPIVCCNF